MLHVLHGLKVSSNRRLPGVPSEAEARPDIEVEFGRFAQPEIDDDHFAVLFPQNDHERQQRPWLKAWLSKESKRYRLRYEDRLDFLVDPLLSKVWCTWSSPLIFDDAVIYFLGPVLGFLLRLRGSLCIHASSIAIDGQAIAFVGGSGSGKSTLAAAFARAGHSVISEDALALDMTRGSWLAHPSYSAIRLWEDSVHSIFGDPDAFAPLNSNWEKRYLDLQGSGFHYQDQPLPLAAIYVLANRSPQPGAPSIEKLNAREAVLHLFANTFGNYLLDRAMRAQEFSQLTRLVRDIPVRLTTAHADLARLGLLQELLLEDQERLAVVS